MPGAGLACCHGWEQRAWTVRVLRRGLLSGPWPPPPLSSAGAPCGLKACLPLRPVVKAARAGCESCETADLYSQGARRSGEPSPRQKEAVGKALIFFPLRKKETLAAFKVGEGNFFVF